MANVVVDKSFAFAVRIVNLCRLLANDRSEKILSAQLLQSGTSIGANIAEAQRAQTRADFNNKMNISLKEANEVEYWLRLLHATNYISECEFNSIYADLEELLALLISICKKTNIK